MLETDVRRIVLRDDRFGRRFLENFEPRGRRIAQKFGGIFEIRIRRIGNLSHQ
jgi:hypothetical protein